MAFDAERGFIIVQGGATAGTLYSEAWIWDGSNWSLYPNYPTSKCVQQPSGIVGWWPGERSANDAIGTNNGIVRNATFTPGIVGQSFNFAGGGEFIEVPDSNSLDLTNEITIEAWVMLNALGDLNFIATKQPSAGGTIIIREITNLGLGRPVTCPCCIRRIPSVVTSGMDPP